LEIWATKIIKNDKNLIKAAGISTVYKLSKREKYFFN
jgi:hypothetical protein